jgi:RNA polymerase sigma factor (sigma-70 family)
VATVEASAIHAAPGIARLPLGLPLLRLRSDEQLLALFRSGNEDAFGAIHDRYRQRLFAYVRQMLCAGPRQDAEDVLQDVFVRAYGALRADSRAVNLRAWLYRVAHNRCIDHLRRPVPPPAEIFELSRKPLHDPIEEAQRREDLARLVEDIGRLPEQQRSALLMREIHGMSYLDLAGALDVTVPAVKSLLVRARVGLVEAGEARDADCADIRADLSASFDRGVKASARARRHMRGCDGCSEYRAALRGMRRSFAALSPAGAGPLAMVGAKLLGLGGAGGGAAAGGSAAAGGGAATLGGVATTVSACKVAAVVCTAALATGGAVEVRHLSREHRSPPAQTARAAAPAAAAPAVHRAAVFAAVPERVVDRPRRRHRTKPVEKAPVIAAPTEIAPAGDDAATAPVGTGSGGAQAPEAPVEAPTGGSGTAPEAVAEPPATAPPAGGGTAEPGTGTPPAEPGPGTPPTEH